MSEDKPNILVVWGDDIGTTNLSCYSHGVMGYRTPNIDRLADEGMLFNTYWDWFMDHVFLVVPAQDIVGEFLQTFVDFPPRQRAASFTIDRVLETLASATTGGR